MHRIGSVGLLLVSGLILALWAVRTPASAENPTAHFSQVARSGQLIALSSDNPQGPQQITLIDPHSRVMGVYHVDRATGQITLKSVRRVAWDLKMDQFNGASPLPREIQAMLGN